MNNPLAGGVGIAATSAGISRVSAPATVFTERLPRSQREFVRSPNTSPDAIDVVRVDLVSFGVRRHWFWPEFVSGWEEPTYRFYRQFVDPRRPVLDLGCWIGPTVLFAAACGARRIVAVEGNPATVEHFRATQAANHKLLAELSIVHAAVHAREGPVAFGNADGSHATSSAASVRGSGFLVPSLTIGAIVRDFRCEDACIIKIDIEGSELEVAEQIADLAGFAPAILLSLHPPFWKGSVGGNAKRILANLRGFRVFDPDGDELDAADVLSRFCYAGSAPPPWGTKYGNFFELVLLA